MCGTVGNLFYFILFYLQCNIIKIRNNLYAYCLMFECVLFVRVRASKQGITTKMRSKPLLNNKENYNQK